MSTDAPGLFQCDTATIISLTESVSQSLGLAELLPNCLPPASESQFCADPLRCYSENVQVSAVTVKTVQVVQVSAVTVKTVQVVQVSAVTVKTVQVVQVSAATVKTEQVVQVSAATVKTVQVVQVSAVTVKTVQVVQVSAATVKTVQVVQVSAATVKTVQNVQVWAASENSEVVQVSVATVKTVKTFKFELPVKTVQDVHWSVRCYSEISEDVQVSAATVKSLKTFKCPLLQWNQWRRSSVRCYSEIIEDVQVSAATVKSVQDVQVSAANENRRRSSHCGDCPKIGPAGPSFVLFLWAATEDAAEAGPDGGDLDGVDEGVEETVAVDQDAGVQHEVAFASRAHVSQCACDGTRHQNACNHSGEEHA